MDHVFVKQDYLNVLGALERTQFSGLNEAKAATLLSQKAVYMVGQFEEEEAKVPAPTEDAKASENEKADEE